MVKTHLSVHYFHSRNAIDCGKKSSTLLRGYMRVRHYCEEKGFSVSKHTILLTADKVFKTEKNLYIITIEICNRLAGAIIN